ncbi:MAG: LysM peptidoglycan-binding domain-containing protein [Cyanobacteria bacterium SIG28]|nr:LysM peptidoglycan-binding domain-containing protein [Cyanobacteria bacterium SIG28]
MALFIWSLFRTKEAAGTNSTDSPTKGEAYTQIFPEIQQNQSMVSFSQSNFWSDDIKSTVYTTLKDLSIGDYEWLILKDNLEAIKSSQSHLMGLIKYYEGDRKHYYESYTARYRDLGGQGTLTGGFGSIRNTKIKTNEDGYKQLMEDLLSHGNEVIKNLGGKSNWEKIPVSIREALVDLAFNKGLDEINKNKTVITNAIDTNDWSSIIPTLKEVKDKNGQEDAGLYRRSLSRAILALRDLEGNELKQAKKEVEKLYSDACEFFDNKKISKKDLEAVWSVYNKEYSKVEVVSAESIKHEVVDGETYWGIATKYCPEGVKVKDFVNAIKDYNYVPLDKDLLEKGRKINIPLQFNGKNIKTEGKTEVEIVPVQQEEKPQKTQSQAQITGKYTISETETENFKVGEEYKGKGYFAVAKDLHSKYIAPGFSITDLSNKIQELNKGIEFEIGIEIKVPKIVASNSTEDKQDVTVSAEQKPEHDEEGLPIFKQMLASGMDYDKPVDIGAKGSNLKLYNFTYKVQQGEGFYRVAEKFDIDWRTLKEFNNLKDISGLKLGQEIKIPKIVYEVQAGDNLTKIQDKFKVSKELLVAMNDIESPNTIQKGAHFALPGYVYEVKKGDNLTKIARNAGIHIDVLKEINNLKSNDIKAGQNLVILFNDMDYNISSDKKKTVVDETSNEVRTQVNTETKATKTRNYFTRDKDKNGNTVATRHVFKPTNTNKNAPLYNKTIIVNAGHGYKPGVTDPDPGALGIGGLEHECYIAYDNAMWLKDELNALGARVIFVQGYEGKASQGLNLVSQEIVKSRNKADYLISLHVNKGKPANNRMEIFYNRETAAGTELARMFETSLEKNNGYSDNQVLVKPAGFQVLRKAKQPAILYEMAFMDHADGRKYLKDKNAQKKNMKLLAQAVADCIKEENKYTKHTVKSGEVLGKIAEKYNVSPADLMKLNGLSKNSVIKVGQVLKIPNSD